jgi:hypothetical protein
LRAELPLGTDRDCRNVAQNRPNCRWIKVKTRQWREANRERYKMFEQD